MDIKLKPLGGEFAINMVRKYSSVGSGLCHLESDKFSEEDEYIRKNLECTLKFYKNVIPPGEWKLEGNMVLKAKEDIEYYGIFVLITGLPVDQKKLGGKTLTNVKFPVEGSGGYCGGDSGEEILRMKKKSKRTFPLGFVIPEELPAPLVTLDGKLIFMMEAFIVTVERRHVKLGEVPVRWMGGRILARKEIERTLAIKLHLSCKRTFATLGRKHSCEMRWWVEKGGYLPGESIKVELLGEEKDHGTLMVECLVELVRKVWCQGPLTKGRRSHKSSVNLTTNVLATAGSKRAFEVKEKGEGHKRVVWLGKLDVPKGITPTRIFESMNGVSYMIRGSVRVAGDEDDWVKGEVPLLIGTNKEEEEEIHGEGEEYEENEELDESLLSFERDSGEYISGKDLLHMGGERGGLTMFKRSHSIPHIPRATSFPSMQSLEIFGSKTLSIFRLPQKFSRYSRRLTLDTLAPF